MEILGYLEQWCEEVAPKEFYRGIFPEGELEKKGVYEEGQYTAIAVSIARGEKKIRRHTVTDDLDKVDELCASDDFCIMAPVSYAGKSRKSSNARFLYAMAVDVDGIKNSEEDIVPEGMETLFWQFYGNGGPDYLPKPTYIVFSGSGLHLYYVFEKAIPLYKNIVTQLETYKRRLTWMLWTQGVSFLHDAVQYESLFQGFRMPGTITKDGHRAKAFLTGDKVTMEYMNQFVPEEFRVTRMAYKSSLTRARAKELYPDWYERRVVNKEKKGRWVCHRGLYDWWLAKIKAEAEDGHRYWCVMTLAVYAKKCNIPKEELENDAFSLVDLMDSKGKRDDNRFTEDDVLAALNAYDEDYVTYPIHTICDRTGIRIEKNKRNGRKQNVHLKIARATRDIVCEDWRKNSGRKNKKNVVEEWQSKNNGGKKTDCIRETGLSKPTVYKYWK